MTMSLGLLLVALGLGMILGSLLCMCTRRGRTLSTGFWAAVIAGLLLVGTWWFVATHPY